MIEDRTSGHAGLVLYQGLTHRQRAARRRSTVLLAVAALFAAGWLAGALLSPSGSAEAARLGPFSYFPSQ